MLPWCDDWLDRFGAANFPIDRGEIGWLRRVRVDRGHRYLLVVLGVNKGTILSGVGCRVSGVGCRVSEMVP